MNDPDRINVSGDAKRNQQKVVTTRLTMCIRVDHYSFRISRLELAH